MKNEHFAFRLIESFFTYQTAAALLNYRQLKSYRCGINKVSWIQKSSSYLPGD